MFFQYQGKARVITKQRMKKLVLFERNLAARNQIYSFLKHVCGSVGTRSQDVDGVQTATGIINLRLLPNTKISVLKRLVEPKLLEESLVRY